VNISNSRDIISLSEFVSQVSLERQARIARFHRQEDAIRSLVAELLVRQAIKQFRQIPDNKINFVLNAFGKPVLQEDPTFHYNITHSGDWVLCAISDSDVGIDIEKMIPLDLQIAVHYFTELEQRYIFAAETVNESRLSRFYEIWTLKESYIKAVGEGLSLSLLKFSVLDDQLKVGSFLHNIALNKNYYFQQFELDPLYKAGVCGEMPISLEPIMVMDAESFYTSLE